MDNRKDARTRTREIMQDFLDKTVDDNTNIATLITITSAEFIKRAYREFGNRAEKNNGRFSREEAVAIIVGQLLSCVNDFKEIPSSDPGEKDDRAQMVIRSNQVIRNLLTDTEDDHPQDAGGVLKFIVAKLISKYMLTTQDKDMLSRDELHDALKSSMEFCIEDLNSGKLMMSLATETIQ